MKHFYILLIAMFLANSAMTQWVPQNSGTTKQLKSVYFTDVNTGYAVGDDDTGSGGIILKTINGGIGWETILVEDSLAFYSVFFTDTITGYVVGGSWSDAADYPAIILKTNDGGMTWSMVFTYSTPVDWKHLSSVFFPDVNTGYAVGCSMSSSGYCGTFMVKTIDGGANWTFVGTGLNNLNSIFFTSVDTGFAVGQGYDLDWIILKTTNGGIDWTATNSGIPWNGGDLMSVYFSDTITGYAVGESNGIALILKTTNGGIDWFEQPSGINQYYLESVCFINSYTGFVTSYDHIFKTTNGGTDWFEQSSGTNHWLNSIYFIDPDIGYIVGWDGTILKTTNGGGYPVGVKDKPSSPSSLKIYPNPSSYIITIGTSAEGHLSIKNLNGQELFNQPISKPSTQIDISNLPVGVYFMRLTNEKTVQVGKIIKE